VFQSSLQPSHVQDHLAVSKTGSETESRSRPCLAVCVVSPRQHRPDGFLIYSHRPSLTASLTEPQAVIKPQIQSIL